jgi:drug/metabolite transporter (DMT)-like permease
MFCCVQGSTSIAAGSRQVEAMLLGVVGVVAFSMTLPATKLALHGLQPVFVSLGRALVAAALSAICLVVTRQPRPRCSQWPRLGVVGVGAVVGFPIMSAFALEHLTAAHSAVITGLLPAATAVMAVLRAGERPSPTFWLACAAGAGCVLVFAWTQGAGSVSVWDLLVLAAVALAGLAYAEGAALTRELGAWQTMCWALVLTAPLLVVPVAAASAGAASAPPEAWLGLAYVSLVSMFLGMFAWYRALSVGGTARIGQLQLAQPVLTLAWSAALLREAVGIGTLVAALAVIGSVAVTQRVR